MYERHFGLSERPFGAMPDAAFYFDSKGHARALAVLRYAVAEGEGLVVLTGDPGTGKTTLVHKLLDEIDRRAVACAHLVSTQLNASELLAAVLRAFGLPAAGSLAESRSAFGAFAARLRASGRRTVAIVDEAHNLLPDALAALVELASVPPGSAAPLELVLVGQPELRHRLPPDRADPRQPVRISCHIAPLSEDETRAYTEHRLRRAGWTGPLPFADDAYASIHGVARGVPRRINRLCDRLLLAAYVGERQVIDAALVAQTRAELDAELGPVKTVPRRAPGAVTRPAGAHERPPDWESSIPTLVAAVDAAPAVGGAEDAAFTAAPRDSNPIAPGAAPAALERMRRIRPWHALAATAAGAAALWAMIATQRMPRSPEADGRDVGASPTAPAPPQVASSPAMPVPSATLAVPAQPAASAEAGSTSGTAAPLPEAPTGAGPPAASASDIGSHGKAPLGAEPQIPSARKRPPAEPARPPPRATKAPAAEPAPVPGPCTAAVAALGLCAGREE
jgi:type II secretory pathway predicted ATPase ExeA